MANLLEPYVPKFSDFSQAANQGYALGETMRSRNLLADAGKQMASGDAKGARNTLYAGGNFDEGGKLDAQFRAQAAAAKTEQLEKAAKFNSMLGSLAMSADTPEKWSKAIATAKGMGLDVSKYGDFSAREFALAQAGKTDEVIKMELERRKEDREASKPIEINGRLVRPRVGGAGYEEVYAAPPKPEGLTAVGPGQTLFDPNTRQPVFSTPEKPQAAYDFTKTGVGNKFTGEFKAFEAGQGEDPEVPIERGKYEQGLRKEYTALTSDLRTTIDSHKRMQSAAKLDSGAGDMAMVYGYMKMLDPTSVVREGEFATAENTGGVGEKIYGLYNKILSGERLTPAQRQQFLEAAGEIAKDKSERFDKVRSQFEGIARKSGADPSRIMLDEGMGQAPGGGPNIPDEAIQMLQKDSSAQGRKNFDEVFGPGASQRILGR